MIVYQDKLTGDELLSDSFMYRELENGVLWEVDGRWVVQEAFDEGISADPCANGGGDDEGVYDNEGGGGDDEDVDDQTVKVIDIVDTFRLQEQPAFDKKQFVTYVKRYITNLRFKLDCEELDCFDKNIESATKFLLSKLADLQFFVGDSMHDDGSLVFAYYFAHGLKAIKC